MKMQDKERVLKQNEILTKAEKLSNDLVSKALLYSIENINEKKYNKSITK